MVRVKRGTIAHKKREKLLKQTKGFRWGRKSKKRAAKDALLHAWSYAFTSRKLKKRDRRGLWQTKIAAGAKAHNTSYSTFIGALKKKHIELDRKILAEIAEHHSEIFDKIIATAK